MSFSYSGPTNHQSTMTHEQRGMLIDTLQHRGFGKIEFALRLARCTDPELHEAWLAACRGEEPTWGPN
jgi:hypothetical protein